MPVEAYVVTNATLPGEVGDRAPKGVPARDVKLEDDAALGEASRRFEQRGLILHQIEVRHVDEARRRSRTARPRRRDAPPLERDAQRHPPGRGPPPPDAVG